jgi:hypothetical protein
MFSDFAALLTPAAIAGLVVYLVMSEFSRKLISTFEQVADHETRIAVIERVCDLTHGPQKRGE